MSKDIIYREDAIEVVKKWFEVIKLNPDILIDSIISIPFADNEIIGKLKTAIENEEICKNCPTAERITVENLLGAMALGFSYGMEADRPQGEWIFDDPVSADFKCSECLERQDICTAFYPCCGADMRKSMKGADDE